MAECFAKAADAEMRRERGEGSWYDVAPGLPPHGTLTGRALAQARVDLALACLERSPSVKISADVAKVLNWLNPHRYAALQVRGFETN
jgi:hypothetical protein